MNSDSGEANTSPAFTAVRHRSIDRDGSCRKVTRLPGAVLIHTVHTWEDSDDGSVTGTA
jgi:hypothetical protein